MNLDMRLGIDLGGTKIEGIIIRTKPEFKIIDRQRISTEQSKGYEHIINQITKLVTKLENDNNLHFEIIGIGTPGTMDPSTQKLKNSNTLCLNGQSFLTDMESALERKVLLANDANCFALAETKLGIVRDLALDAKVVFGVIMGTGVGGGLVVNGQIVGGRHGIGGEWGHIYLDDSGGDCYCGKVGCVEQVISGPALERYYADHAKRKKSLKQIVIDSTNGKDIHAMHTMRRLYTMFGKGISVITNIIDPDVIVLGGGLGNIDGLYTQGQYELGKHIFNNSVETKILKPKLGDSAGVIGAALLG